MTTTHTPDNAPAPGTGPGGSANGPRIFGVSVRLTAGGYVLALLAVLVSGLTLPSAEPGWQPWEYVAASVGVAALLIAGLAAHELAHALTARRHGAQVAQVTVGFAGGSGHGRSDLPGPRAQGRVAAAGPAASLTIAAVCAAVAAALSAWGAGRLPVLALTTTAGLSALYGAFSLLPGTGTDGGRIVRALAWARTGDPARASLIAARAGQVTGALLAAAGLAAILFGYLAGIGVAFIGFLVMAASRSEARQLLAATAVAGLRVRDVLPQRTPEPSLQSWITVQSFVDDQAADPDQARATAFALHDFDGQAGLVTLAQLAAVPAGRRGDVRLRDVATPVAFLVTTTPDEPLGDLLARMSTRPASLGALLTAGHAIVLDDDGALLGVLTPADVARASQLGALRRGERQS